MFATRMVFPQTRFTPTQKISTEPMSERWKIAISVMIGETSLASKVMVPSNTRTGIAEHTRLLAMRTSKRKKSWISTIRRRPSGRMSNTSFLMKAQANTSVRSADTSTIRQNMTVSPLKISLRTGSVRAADKAKKSSTKPDKSLKAPALSLTAAGSLLSCPVHHWS